jgi:hypothetical protein
MRGTFACVAAATLLALPVVALAATRDYEGNLDGDEEATIIFKVVKQGDARKVTAFGATQIPISCGGGEADARLRTVKVTGEFEVGDRGGFRATADEESQMFKAIGELSANRLKASGTLRYEGRTSVDGVLQDCESGKLEWSAKR